MKDVFGLLWCLILSGLFCVLITARSSYGSFISFGSSLSPLSHHETIRMESMRVTIRLRRESYTLDALYSFVNTGDTRKELVGFMKSGMPRPSYFPILSDFIRFNAWVNGRQALFSYHPDFLDLSINREIDTQVFTDPQTMVNQVVFPGIARTTIRVRYDANYEGHQKSVGDCGRFYLKGRYWFGPARYWKDKIGQVTFVIDYTDVGGITNSLSCTLANNARTITENVMMYRCEDVEPSANAQLIFGYKSPD